MKALITGINGQDGSYLAELLLEKGYEVHGIIRRSSLENAQKLDNLKNVQKKITLYPCNIEDHLALYKLIAAIRPDECYHLAASSFVSYSFEEEATIIATNFNSTHYLLSSLHELAPECKFYFAGSSEMFGEPEESPQHEKTRFNPRSIYGISKVSSYYVVKNYREHYKMYACTGMTYNHESPRRDFSFVTRKISMGVAKIYLKKSTKIQLGNMEAIRDWGYSPEYVVAMWQMLNNPSGPKDYVLATGISHSVRDFVRIAFDIVGLNYQNYVEINPQFFRPSEQKPLLGNAQLIQKELGWKNQTPLEKIIEKMVENDIEFLSKN